jgi:hypothetical protein
MNKMVALTHIINFHKARDLKNDNDRKSKRKFTSTGLANRKTAKY